MRSRHAAAFALSAFALAGCPKKAPPPFAVQKLTVSEESLAAAPSLGLGAKQMQTEVETSLRRQGAVLLRDGEPAPAGAEAFKLRAEVDQARLDDVPFDDGGVGQEAVVEVIVEASRSGSDGTEKISGDGTARVEAPAAPDLDGQAQSFKKAFDRALELATARLVRAQAASLDATEKLQADLQSTDGGVREAAADVLVDRKDAAAVPVLIQELDAPEDNVRMKAIGELVELRAKAAVPKLIDLAQTHDPRLGADPHFQMQIIYALGSIGGEEAEAYLYTIASGHPDEMVRKAAREATAELKHEHAPPPETKP